MVLDFNDTSRAISERLIKREQERISEEKDHIKESQKAILDAFSFEAVRGASEQMQLKHLENLNSVTDKWSKVMADSGHKLNYKQMLELQKDKQSVEAMRMNMATNIKEFETAQKVLLEDHNAMIYDESSHEAFAQAYKEGKMGDPEFSWLNILKPRQRGLSEYLDKELSPYKASALANIDVRGYTISPDGTITWNENNERFLKSSFESMFSTPLGQRIYKSYGGTPEAKERMKNEYDESLKRDMQKEQFSYQAQRNFMQGAASSNAIARKYGWSGLNDEQTANMTHFNNFAEKVRQRDRATLEILKSRPIPYIGTPLSVDIDDNGDIVITGKPGSDKIPPRIVLPVPDENATEDQVKEFKMGLINLAPGFSGKQIPSNVANYVVADWKEAGTIEPTAPKILRQTREYLSTGNESALVGTEPTRKKLAARIERLVPGVRTRTLSYGNKVIITEGDETTEFSLNKTSDRKALSDWIEARVGWKTQVSPEEEEGAEEPESSFDYNSLFSPEGQ